MGGLPVPAVRVHAAQSLPTMREVDLMPKTATYPKAIMGEGNIDF